jgi:RimJ/RimL family protein N-acetyltransferase
MIARRIDLPAGLALRPISADDLEFLYNLYAATRWEELSVTDWSDDQKHSFLRQQFEAQHAHYQKHYPNASWDLILQDGEAVGRLYVEEWPSQVRLIDIVVAAEVRNRGLGRALLEALMARCRELRKPLTIHVEIYNPAMRLYQRLGFRQIEDKGVYHLMEWRPE